MGSVQVAKGTSVTVTETFRVDGTPADLDSGVPTVAALFPDGTALTPAPTASGSWTGRTTGQYRIVLDGQAEVTYLDPITWTGTIGGKTQKLYNRVEWIGDYLFGLADLRALRVAGSQPFSTTATPLFSNQQIMDARAATLDEFEQILGFSPVPRFRRETLDGDGSTCLELPGLRAQRVLSVTVNGVAQTASNYQIGRGNMLEAVTSYGTGTAFTVGRRNVVVEWVHGWERVVGLGRDVAMVMAAKELLPSGFSNFQTVSTPDGVSYTYEPSETGRGGFQRHTGVRDLDRWLNRHAQPGAMAAR